MITVEKTSTLANFEKHMSGDIGMGVVPVTDEGTCYFAAIDIDNHSGEVINHKEIHDKIVALKIPLVLCKSKSGGAHLYLFGTEPMKTGTVRSLMIKWAADLGYSGEEVFPKQEYLRLNHDGSRAFGNWINLPYFGDSTPKGTERYAINSDGKLNMELFLSHAESFNVTQESLEKLYYKGHPDAPPCIQKILASSVSGGFRNEALYNCVVYLKKAFPDSYRNKAFDLNTTIFDKALVHQEASKTISSAARRSYKYKCGEEPLKSNCNRKVCLGRKFGISEADADHLDDIAGMPKFTELKKFDTDPVEWELTIDGKSMVVPTMVLMDYRLIRRTMTEVLLMVPPILNAAEWERQLKALMDSVVTIATPDDASTPGMIRARLQEFIERADLTVSVDNINITDREALLRGQPVVQVLEDKKCAAFRGPDFVAYLKYTKSEELRGTALWLALRKAGVKHGRMRINEKIVNIWYAPIQNKTVQFSEIDFDPGF
jgi:hypothetical protein